MNLWKRKSTLGIFQPNLKISSPTFSTKLFLVEVVVETMAFNQHPWYIDEEAHLFVGTNVVDNGFVESVKTAQSQDSIGMVQVHCDQYQQAV